MGNRSAIELGHQRSMTDKEIHINGEYTLSLLLYGPQLHKETIFFFVKRMHVILLMIINGPTGVKGVLWP